MTNQEIISTAISASLNGDSLPSYKSDEFRSLLDAIIQIGDSPNRAMAYSDIGRSVIDNLLSRMSASINAEKEIQIIKNKGEGLC